MGESQDKIKAIDAQQPAWAAGGAAAEMPVYFEWFFRTGENDDFESLVKALDPRTTGSTRRHPRHGLLRPGFVRADDPLLEVPGTRPSVIGLEGALKSPSTVSTVFPNPPATREFPDRAAEGRESRRVSTPADFLAGSHHHRAAVRRARHAKKFARDVVELDIDSNSWVNDLNRDPRTRVPAGFGTRVMQKNQETYVREAWRQVQRILDLNRLICSTVFNMLVATKYTQKTFNTLKVAPLLAVSRPVLSKVMGSQTTIYHQLRESRLPTAVVSGTFRRLVRPNGTAREETRCQQTLRLLPH